MPATKPPRTWQDVEADFNGDYVRNNAAWVLKLVGMVSQLEDGLPLSRQQLAQFEQLAHKFSRRCAGRADAQIVIARIRELLPEVQS